MDFSSKSHNIQARKYHFRKSHFEKLVETHTFERQLLQTKWRSWCSKPTLSKPTVSKPTLSKPVYYAITWGFVSTSSCHVACACILLLTLTEACMRTPRDSCIFTTCSATFRKCRFGPVYYEKETLSFKSEKSSKPTLSKVWVWACILHP